jgi:hypothetical protein
VSLWTIDTAEDIRLVAILEESAPAPGSFVASLLLLLQGLVRPWSIVERALDGAIKNFERRRN